MALSTRVMKAAQAGVKGSQGRCGWMDKGQGASAGAPRGVMRAIQAG